MAKFKASARTLDMLGRQQIAGIPTAISELFKNAHDAYADNVEVDYYRSDGLFVLRDDGLGMTEQDFKERWLTLGTESKLQTSRLAPLPKDPDKLERPILGEKGIGRLAIASIGPQVLIMTRAKRPDGLQNLVTAFINWTLFELPGIDLDDVVIPMTNFPGGTLPSRTDIKTMVKDVISNVKNLENAGKITNEQANRILNQLEKFDFDPQKTDEYLEEPSLAGNGQGTHFYILPADENLQADIEGEKLGGSIPKFIRMLIGFTNTMASDTNAQKINVRFRDHKTDDAYKDLIEEGTFFTPEEFRMADHHFEGEFDEFGQFQGKVTVYGEETFEHRINWKGAKGKKTLCGPFKISVAYVQGLKAQTKIPPEDYALIDRKTDQIGGLYIYKEGIRILPYGDSDVDWLDIEKRRTKSASYYYFSYRRMFGYIDITSRDNNSLIEKAGREGFMENKAYRQFRGILGNFFTQLAADFFREGGGPKSEFWLERRAELERCHWAKKKREKRATERKDVFIKSLKEFFEQTEKKEPKSEVDKLLESTRRNFEVAVTINDPNDSAQALLNYESDARRGLDAIRSKYKIPSPRGFALRPKTLENDWNAYHEEYNNLESNLFEPTVNKIAEMLDNYAMKNELEINRRLRLEKSIDTLITEAKTKTNLEAKETRAKLKEVQDNLLKLTREVMADTDDTVKDVLSEIARMDISEIEDTELVSKRSELEAQIISEAERNEEVLESIRLQLENIIWIKDKTGEIITSTDINEALEEELFDLKERADLDLELSQLGMAIGVIHHEFSGTVKSIRQNIRRLKAWADVNEDLLELYRNIRTNFEHLDGYLTLFTPLNRRLYRNEVEITGNGIKKFLDDIFKMRLERYNIDLKPTLNFKKKTILGYPSTFYPVFVNVVDNAIFWLKDKPGNREIILDADENGFSISDNGPKILPKDWEIIFELGYTTKPNGKGMGLYISREVLSKVGYRIFVAEHPYGEGTTFRIEPEKMQSEET